MPKLPYRAAQPTEQVVGRDGTRAVNATPPAGGGRCRSHRRLGGGGNRGAGVYLKGAPVLTQRHRMRTDQDAESNNAAFLALGEWRRCRNQMGRNGAKLKLSYP